MTRTPSSGLWASRQICPRRSAPKTAILISLIFTCWLVLHWAILLIYGRFAKIFNIPVIVESPSAVLLEAEIVARSRKLAEPRNYFKGAPDEEALVPRNILMFSRTKSSVLGRGGTTIPPHHRFVLVSVMAGQGKVSAGPATHPIGSGEALLILPFQPHCFMDLKPADIDWVFTTFELPREERLEVMRGRGAWKIDAQELEHLRQLLTCWQSKGQRTDLSLHLALWLRRILRRVVGSAKAKPRHFSTDDNGKLVASVNRFALERMSQPLITQDVAVGIGVSASSLRARFKAATGKAVASHLREIKLYHACELLHTTRLRVGEISTRCGYDSLFAFSRAFRTAYGCAPREYRIRSANGGVSGED